MLHRRDIDGLRALAVLPVVLFHAGLGFFPGGFVGVDIFFVISGYLITGIIKPEIDSSRFSVINFYERRARRILPAFFAVLLATEVAGWFLLLPEDYQGFAQSAIAATLFVSNIFFWSQSDNYFDQPAETKPLLHTWSLSVEEQFYVVFPVVIFALSFLVARRKNGSALVAFAIGALTLLSFILAAWATYYKPVAAFYWLPTRAWELMLGALLALGVVKPARRQWVAECAAATGVALILFAALFYGKTTPFPGLSALPPTLGAALILYAGQEGRMTLVGHLLSLWPLHFIGLISYSLYLWHWPLIVFGKFYFGEDADSVVMSSIVLASFVPAALSWRFIEQPFRVKRGSLARGRIFALSGSAIAVAVVCSMGIVETAGFPARFPAAVLSVLDRHQYEEARYGECHLASERHLTARNLCLRGAEGQKASFVLIGDSHAAALAGGIFKAAREVGLAGYQLSDSGWRPTFPYIRLSRDWQDRWMHDQLTEMLENPAISRVLIVVNWGSAIGQRYLASGKVVEGTRAVPAGIVALVQRYPQKHFILLEDTPAARSFGVRNLAYSMLFHRTFDPRISADDYRRERDAQREALRPVSQQSNVSWVSISDALCDAQYCYGQRNGRTIYYDLDHLTTQFAEEHASTLGRLFQDVKAAR